MKKKMIAPPVISTLSPQYAKVQFELVIEALNVPRPVRPVPREDTYDFMPVDQAALHRELRRLIDAWQRCDEDLNRLFKKHTELSQKCMNGHTILVPNRNGEAQLAWLPFETGHKVSSQEEVALGMFISFLVNPLSRKLGGPCARCHRYYRKKTQQQKVYCNRTCGTRNTALIAQQRRRKADYDALLEKARKALSKLMALSRRPVNWKKWVSDEAGIGIKWLSRALNEGRLEIPAGYGQVR